MIISFLIALFFQFALPQVQEGTSPEWWQMAHWQLVVGIVVTTLTWLTITYLTKPTEKETLKGFVKLTRPGGPGWKKINEELESEGHPKIVNNLPSEILLMFVGVFTVYSALFATGFWIYSNIGAAILSSVLLIVGTYFLIKLSGKLKFE